MVGQVTTVPVHITSTPEGIGTLYAVTHSKKLGKHNVYECNNGQVGVDVPPERTFQALKDLPIIDLAEANILMREAYDHNPKFTVARAAEYALIIAGIVSSGGVGGIVAVSPKIAAGIVSAIGITHMVGDKLKGEVPSLDPFLANSLNDTVHLGPAGSPTQCARRVVFTSVIHGVHGYDLIVDIPVAPGAIAAPAVRAQLSTEEKNQVVALVFAVAYPS